MLEFVDMQIAELLCSRLCHELASPIGAVNNGIEMIEEFDGSMLQDALPLIGSSAKMAAARLNFYRMAYGTAGTQSIASLNDLKELAGSYFAEGRTGLSWPADSLEPALEDGWGKLLLNILSLAADTLPRGGVLSVAFDEDSSAARITVAAEGEGARISEECRLAMSPDVSLDSLTPRSVHAYFVARLSERLLIGIDIGEEITGRIAFTVRLTR